MNSYTYKLIEEDQPFEEFALQCARAFGACNEQRDDPANEPPKLQEVDDYHFVELEKAREKLAEVEQMSEEQASIEVEEQYNRDIKYYKEQLENKRKIKDRLVSILQQAKNYKPPSDEHIYFKEFMIEQLEQSIKYDGDTSYYERELIKIEKQTGEEYKKMLLDMAKRDIQYHTEHWNKALERHSERNQWIKQLYKSLGMEIK
jgi:hypothetical protein